MDTAIKSDKEKIEYFDSKEDLIIKVEQLVEWIKSSEHFTAFTGAGISTSCGIKDFRSGINTKLDVGAGVWELKAQGKKTDSKPTKSTSVLKAYPSKTHMALKGLMDKNILKFLISQNTDGLHRKSGVDPNKFAELHGNTNLEKCLKCKKEYLRDYRTRTALKVHDHLTGRFCDDKECNGKLVDSIINFSENLPQRELELGFNNCEISDLCLCLGSSLRVTPAADMPLETVNKGGKLVIVNLQKTPLNDIASLVIHAKIDDVMEMVMDRLNIDIPRWVIERRFHVNLEEKTHLVIRTIDSIGNTFSYAKSITLENNKNKVALKKEPFIFKGPFSKETTITFEFQGYYDEPNLKIPIDIEILKELSGMEYILRFDPGYLKWFEIIPIKLV